MVEKQYSPNILSLESKDFKEIFEKLKKLPKKTEKFCPNCTKSFDFSPILIYATCPNCKYEFKTRAFSGYIELEDVIVMILDWLGKGEEKEFILSEHEKMGGILENWQYFFEE
ncbi:MAG: hypothetical protein JW891_02770 [Candidatus Lokiarchaeota archaeon]|nr:hypothetical protein [Candidatus Lokiarchaeota archaeon]